MNIGALLTRNIGGLPAWAWLGIVGGGGIALFLYFRRQSNNGGSNTLGQNTSSQPIDTSQIDPYTGVPYSIEGSINPNTGLPAYYGGQGVDPSTGTPTSGSTPQTGTIRGPSGANGPTGSYDKSHSGVPLDSAPGGKSFGTIPWNAVVTLLGPAVQGPSNRGNTAWQPVSYNGQYGYISAFDLSNGGSGGLSASANMAPARAAQPFQATQATPFWPNATDLNAAQGRVA